MAIQMRRLVSLLKENKMDKKNTYLARLKPSRAPQSCVMLGALGWALFIALLIFLLCKEI